MLFGNFSESGFELNTFSFGTLTMTSAYFFLASCHIILFVMSFSLELNSGLLFNSMSNNWLIFASLAWLTSFDFPSYGSSYSVFFAFFTVWLALNPSSAIIVTNWGFMVYGISCLAWVLLFFLQSAPILLFVSLEVLTFLVILTLLVFSISLNNKMSAVLYLWPSALSGVLLFLGLSLAFNPTQQGNNIALTSTLIVLSYSLKVGLLPSGLWLRDFYSSLGFGGMVVYLLLFYTITILCVAKILTVTLTSSAFLTLMVLVYLVINSVWFYLINLSFKLNSVLFCGTICSSSLLLGLVTSVLL